VKSLRAIAAGLEERGIPTARGGKWSAMARLLEAAGSPFGESVAAEGSRGRPSMHFRYSPKS
jgi:hypothetical protein